MVRKNFLKNKLNKKINLSEILKKLPYENQQNENYQTFFLVMFHQILSSYSMDHHQLQPYNTFDQ